MSWKDDLGKIRLLGPDGALFAQTVQHVWEHIEKLDATLQEIEDIARSAKVRQEGFTLEQLTDNPSRASNEAIHSLSAIRALVRRVR